MNDKTLNMKKFWNILLLSFLITLLREFYYAEGTMTECSPPVPNCLCDAGTLLCHGYQVNSFPVVNDSNIRAFSFEECSINEISEVPYVNAVELVIQNCAVNRISETAFSKLPNLEVLVIAGNVIRNISSNVFTNLTALTDLDLSNNKLQALPDRVLHNLPKLKNLDLSGNSIQLATLLPENSNITHFRCYQCNLNGSSIKAISTLKNLRNLDLNGNNFTKITSEYFSGISSLEELHLDRCSVSNIEQNAFQNLKQLKVLILGNNRLGSLSKEMFLPMWTSLQKLHLERNVFTTLREDVAPWKQLTEIKLGDNPWSCDCLIVWMSTYKNITTDWLDMQCDSPLALKLRKLSTIKDNEMCYPTEGRTAVVLGIAIPIIVICVGLIGYYLWQIWRSRQRQARDRRSFKYRSVYGDTVESNSKQSIVS